MFGSRGIRKDSEKIKFPKDCKRPVSHNRPGPEGTRYKEEGGGGVGGVGVIGGGV